MIEHVRHKPIVTLILTHPSNRVPLEQPGNSRVCVEAWQKPPVKCDYKLWLYTKSGFFPYGLKIDPAAQAKFSDGGGVDENDTTILEEGFIAPGHNYFLLGGGFLDLCLSNTFDSLVRIAAKRRERVVVSCPLPLIYSASQLDRTDYLTNQNAYTSFLARSRYNGDISGYRYYFDGKLIKSEGENQVCLSWYSRLNGLAPAAR
ncbi:MAG: hypothetical protein KKC80_02620 [Candidatus Margulisbacteria bacterium]|nr:hypothetical protein [Candidatus Margulisiibacteriota bacterium]MBU1617305.1 hypothetical protein [Candidatus Margulisiibacteriota bacterium]MBU1867621.1 hypothetical protein [Candidatus Margulisiibacteriota bacterium]